MQCMKKDTVNFNGSQRRGERRARLRSRKDAKLAKELMENGMTRGDAESAEKISCKDAKPQGLGGKWMARGDAERAEKTYLTNFIFYLFFSLRALRLCEKKLFVMMRTTKLYLNQPSIYFPVYFASPREKICVCFTTQPSPSNPAATNNKQMLPLR